MFMCSFVCDTCALMCVCERACPFDRMLVPVCAFLPYPQVLISDLTVVLIRFYWLFFSRSPTIRTNTIGSDRIESDPTRFNSIRIPGRVEKKIGTAYFSSNSWYALGGKERINWISKWITNLQGWTRKNEHKISNWDHHLPIPLCRTIDTLAVILCSVCSVRICQWKIQSKYKNCTEKTQCGNNSVGFNQEVKENANQQKLQININTHTHM